MQMRSVYREELDSLIHDLVTMTELVRVAVKDATSSLLNADLTLAESVVSGDERLDAMHSDIEIRAFNLLARESPVAGELRIVVAALRMTFELARMGDLAAHVAKIARLRYPEKAVPDAVEPSFANMAVVADHMIETATKTLAERDPSFAMDLADDDEVMDKLRRDQFKVLLGEEWPHGIEAAVDTALLGRYYERIADHAVALGRRIVYILTGEAPDGENWPNTF